MVICSSCRAEQMNGTMFCSECGNDLQTPAVATYGLPNEKITVAKPVSSNAPTVMPSPPAPKARPTPGSITHQPPARRSSMNQNLVRNDLKLTLLNSGRLLECPDRDNVIIGRSDKITGDMPDIDLAADNALGLGVSRRHACITFRDGRPYLTDLGSLNRTWLNRQIMMRGQPYQLKDGDEIRLGNAILKIVYNP